MTISCSLVPAGAVDASRPVAATACQPGPAALDAVVVLAAVLGGLVYGLLPPARVASPLFGETWLLCLGVPAVWLLLRLCAHLADSRSPRPTPVRQANHPAGPRRQPRRQAMRRSRPLRSGDRRRAALAALMPNL